MRKALITGIAGFAGGHLAESLIEAGWEVAGIERHGAVLDHPVFLLDRVKVEECDILAARELGRVIGEFQPDAIFHLAGTTHIPMAQSDPQMAFETNIKGSLNILDATAASAPSARLILVSSAEVYGKSRPEEMPLTEDRPLRPASIYGLTKLCAEETAFYYARTRGLDAVVLRPFNHIGPGQRPRFVSASFALQIARIEKGLQPPVLEVGNLDPARDFTDARDMVRGYRLAVGKCDSGSVYNICSGRAYPIREILDRLLKLSDLEIEVRPSAERTRATDVPIFRGDHSRFTAATGWRPEYGIDDTLKAILDYWRGRVKLNRGKSRG
ncbi:MAG: GDP-mannose 4,6-dehydratase [Candidatus Erginobacter occultus]|nr:GDP-mannose 4,6-dehydratase [Candidatus Erginobacter occultus]